MRWLVALVGAAILVTGSWLSLRLIRRPELRVALNLRPGNPDDAALAAGVDLALEEREFGAGRYRLRTAHQIDGGRGRLLFPELRAHTMLPWFEPLKRILVEGGDVPLLRPEARQEAAAVLAWARGRKLRFLAIPSGRPLDTAYRPQRLASPASLEIGTQARSAGVALGTYAAEQDSGAFVRRILATLPAPDIVFLDGPYAMLYASIVEGLRASGFTGPIFLPSALSDLRIDGCFTVRSALKPPPDLSGRRLHPLADLGYRATLRYLDAMDRAPNVHPLVLAREQGDVPHLDEFMGEARIFVIRNGRLLPD